MAIHKVVTKVKNTSGASKHFGFLYPHGKTLANNEEYEIVGDLGGSIWDLHPSDRLKTALQTALNDGDLTIVESPQANSRVLADFTANAGSVSTDETDLYSYTIPAGTISQNGQKIIASFTVNTAAHAANTSVLKVYFGGTARFTSGALVTTSAQSHKVLVEIIRTGTTTARVTTTLLSPGTTVSAAATPVSGVEADMTGLDFTAAIVIKISGTRSAGSDDDILAKHGYIEWKAAA